MVLFLHHHHNSEDPTYPTQLSTADAQSTATPKKISDINKHIDSKLDHHTRCTSCPIVTSASLTSTPTGQAWRSSFTVMVPRRQSIEKERSRKPINLGTAVRPHVQSSIIDMREPPEPKMTSLLLPTTRREAGLGRQHSRQPGPEPQLLIHMPMHTSLRRQKPTRQSASQIHWSRRHRPTGSRP